MINQESIENMTEGQNLFEAKNIVNRLNEGIIEESTIEEKELTEEEAIRMGYDNAYPEDYVDTPITINAFYLGEMNVDPAKPKKNGETYHSSKCVLQCYYDNDEIRIPFFIENFNEYNKETGNLVVSGKNVLARIIRKIKNTNSNRFVVNYEILREVINETTDLPITIKEFIQYNGYKDYTIE